MRNLLFLLFTLITFTATAQEVKSYDEVDEKPRFVACQDKDLKGEDLDKCAQDAFLTHIFKNLSYPAEARKNNTEGKVILKFVINKYGRIENATIAQDLENNCGTAALNALLSLNELDQPFFPGRKNKIAVPVEMQLPVKFSL